ncbi:unnamed protein product, partial [Mesorhabditis belari]|uniref:Condensin-2 complex subunit H2 n=1 Tax=Mesorhabditis belari TaxID=2138241 RepID=A0AAF3ENA6_9BILA
MADEEVVNSRFKHLLNPIKDLAKNFNLDLQKDLNNYLQEINELDDAKELQIDLDAVLKFNFAEAGAIVKGSANVYGRKVEFVYEAACSFNQTIGDAKKMKKLAGAGVDDDDGGGGSDGELGGEEGQKKKRARTHDNDPLSFPSQKHRKHQYFDAAILRKNSCKEYLGVDFVAARMKEPKMLNLLPEELRAMPDGEKLPICVVGLWARSIEAVGKFEDFWTLSYTTVTPERRWVNEMKQEEHPHHAAKVGGCAGCADKDCPDANYLIPTMHFGPKMAGRMRQIVLKSIYLDLSKFMTIRREQLESNWVCHGDLRPRSGLWDSTVNEVRAKRKHQLEVVKFAVENVMDENNYTAALTRRGRITGMTGSQNPLSQLSSQQSSQQTCSQRASQETQFVEIDGMRFPGRASSRLEMARKSLSTNGRTSTRLSIQVLQGQRELYADDDSFGGGGFDDDEGENKKFNPFDVRPLQESRPNTRSASTAPTTGNVNSWVEEACTSQKTSLPKRDLYLPLPRSFGPQMQTAIPKAVPVRRRCEDVLAKRKDSQKKLLSMPMNERFSNLNWKISAGNAAPPTDANWLGIVTVNMRNTIRVLIKSLNKFKKPAVIQKRNTSRARSGTIGVNAEEGSNKETQETDHVADPWADMDDDFGPADDSFDNMKDVPLLPDPNSQPIGDNLPRFSDLNQEDIRCELIDPKLQQAQLSQVADPFSRHSLHSALDTVLAHPEMNATSRLNVFLQHAYTSDDSRSTIQRAVQDWEDSILPLLEKEMHQKAFDVHDYGKNTIEKFDSIGETVPFEQLCQGLEIYEVSRVFLSCLMMTNTNNVELNFDAKNPIDSLNLKLLNADRPHERLDEDGIL